MYSLIFKPSSWVIIFLVLQIKQGIADNTYDYDHGYIYDNDLGYSEGLYRTNPSGEIRVWCLKMLNQCYLEVDGWYAIKPWWCSLSFDECLDLKTVPVVGGNGPIKTPNNKPQNVPGNETALLTSTTYKPLPLPLDSNICDTLPYSELLSCQMAKSFPPAKLKRLRNKYLCKAMVMAKEMKPLVAAAVTSAPATPAQTLYPSESNITFPANLKSNPCGESDFFSTAHFEAMDQETKQMVQIFHYFDINNPINSRTQWSFTRNCRSPPSQLQGMPCCVYSVVEVVAVVTAHPSGQINLARVDFRPVWIPTDCILMH